ncbi:MAG: hypothetical protein A3C80_04310 [Candidatus Ryanbacteria bacterium RIFCSPHIGHO2_02_FULL_45_43]|uniref:Dephospho-CoA kinase n=1 Tax=Candidatus Ryanbacteria bacterium RIFCSPHIGHO2_01_45_13 TaxID=1802112 RepID=A0A1G2FYW1_9BACT|nr:MAG: hypothetical protein A2718_00335 [Candidatus Ryanbacteria bacterium RIFCSPHIGHO2_01_FULL_44_130]OGZ42800.1 MAG: hypothetical protein A2W41_00575 [Candidatus Ryanbacteria bacterium RIFCSPHIGHO2_01_45_13]OGZ48255.1 MAG: hypothetical protein A3C80_04310 [Candidatus Ryanbacteria bacterium RIFCSPHIGHO2_02_FULL_45_43]OGZ50031.1 MAG: hypothetical protein A3E55_01970 [Candidatus Ryanbacteria bacterium RIFCSPHIGHO2_12_FULL_44_20]OGZ51489.1 MAG: hypothetical protein A3A17_01915 [Candidatus Ryanba
MIIIALTGKKGSGKGTVADYIKIRHGAVVFRFSKILDDILIRLHLPHTRDNQIQLALDLRQLYGNDILAKVLAKDIQSTRPDIAVVDGVRYQDEWNIIKTLPNAKLIAMSANADKRYQRITMRNEKADDTGLSQEQFNEQEARKTELQIDSLLKIADHSIINDGTLDELNKKIEHVLSLCF